MKIDYYIKLSSKAQSSVEYQIRLARVWKEALRKNTKIIFFQNPYRVLITSPLAVGMQLHLLSWMFLRCDTNH